MASSDHTPRRIAVIRQGARPRLNARLAAMLAEQFPGYEVDDIDVLAEVRARRLRWTLVAAGAVMADIRRVATRRVSVKQAIVTSAPFARAVRRHVRTRVSAATHAFTFQSQSLFSADVPGVPHFVYTDHAHMANLAYPGFDRRSLASRRYLSRECDGYHSARRVFVRSTHVRDVLVHSYGLSPERVVDVGVGANVPILDRDPTAWHGGRIAFVGVDWERKGGPLLLEAFRRVRAAFPDCRLEVVGCSPEVRLDGVTVHGRMAAAGVAGLLAECDVFCLPTRAEPFGVAFIEAMHAGLPVVGPRLGAVPDFVVDGVTGRLVEPDDPTALENALASLLADPERALAMGAAGQALARERYDWPVVMGAIGDAIRTALAECVPPPRRPLRVAALVVGMRVDGGAETVVRTLLRELRATPCDATVFTLRRLHPKVRDELERLGASVVELPGRKLVSPRRFGRLLRALHDGRFDVIHTHLTGANLLGLLCGGLLRIPVVVTLHSTRSSADDHWYHGRLERWLIRHFATRVLAVGEETASARSEVLGGDVDIRVLNNAVAPTPPPTEEERDRLRREVMDDPSGVLFLSVGRLVPAKAHDNLIEAFVEVRRRLPEAELAIAGRGKLGDELRTLASARGLGGSVHFLGRREDARRLIASADVFVSSSVWEGLPMALLEAMEAGTPVVATDVGDVGDVLRDTPSRVVVPGDVPALAEAMVATVDDIRRRRDLTSAAKRVVAERYSSAAWAECMLDHYYDVARVPQLVE